MGYPPLPPQRATCSVCGHEKGEGSLVFEGPDLQPICYPCLSRVDPARAAILERLARRREEP